MDRVVIIGLGLIGGSIGMALKAGKVRNLEVVGVDREWGTVNAAKKMGAVDLTERIAAVAVKNAQLVIVATPLMAIPEVFQEIAPNLPEGCIVTDVGSTKARVLEWAAELLPSKVDFVGGHPLAGKETSGIQSATPGLFQQATYCIVPAPSASKAAVEVIIGLATSVGATPYFVGAAEHDLLVAGVSHLPLLLSAALVSSVSKSPSWDDMSRLASSGFRDVSRLASSDVELSKGISLTNKEGILHWLDDYIDVLRRYRLSLVDDADTLLGELASARIARDKWVAGLKEPRRGGSTEDIPTTSELMTELFVGGKMSQIMRDQDKKLKEMEKKNG